MTLNGFVFMFVDEIIFEKTDQTPPYIYHFDGTDKFLSQVRSSDNSSFVYLDERITKISDNFGNLFKVHYGDNGFVERIQQFRDGVILHVAE